jgi:hypothetical protein
VSRILVSLSGKCFKNSLYNVTHRGFSRPGIGLGGAKLSLSKSGPFEFGDHSLQLI